jgi:S-adenosylmethionine hydrolase
MAIVLFTDFGAADLYAGQVEAVLDRLAPGVGVIHLLHEAPAFDVKASAHLLAALARGLAPGDVLVGVVDPGVGTGRDAVVVRADDRWYVGPDNGLFSVAAARAARHSVWRIVAPPPGAAATFHGRDVFAPLAAAIATRGRPDASVTPADDLSVQFGGADLAELIYIDHYGNAWTGLRAEGLPRERILAAGGLDLPNARVFADARVGEPFWYENSSGLVEIAVNRGSAADRLGLAVGMAVTWR